MIPPDIKRVVEAAVARSRMARGKHQTEVLIRDLGESLAFAEEVGARDGLAEFDREAWIILAGEIRVAICTVEVTTKPEEE